MTVLAELSQKHQTELLWKGINRLFLSLTHFHFFIFQFGAGGLGPDWRKLAAYIGATFDAVLVNWGHSVCLKICMMEHLHNV